MSDSIKIVGVVDAIYFENPTNLYKVVRILVDEELSDVSVGSEIVVTGQFALLHLDTSYEFYGKITNHPKYGEQFNVTHYQQITPTSEIGLIEYLSSDRFKGIGNTLAERIVDHLGVNAIDKILENKDVLKDIEGLTKKNADNLYKTLMEHRGTERVFIQLTEWGFGPKISEKIYKKWGNQSIEIIKENPYLMVESIEGISFVKADNLAEVIGIDALSIYRVIAAIYAVIYQVSMNDGDTYIEINHALNMAREKLEASRPALISNELLLEALKIGVEQDKFCKVDDTLMINSLYYAEMSIARKFQELLKYEDVERFEMKLIEEALEEVSKENNIQYDDIQKDALLTAINSPISIITGGPGTGKTTLIKGIIAMHSKLNDYDLEEAKKYPDKNPILLAAPTGRAAKRMSDTTELPAATIHRLIGFTRDTTVEALELNELEGSLLIVDEMSMVDTWLMNWLLRAIPYHMQVVFVGDRDQLPSVGPGQIFADIIDSKMLPTITLQKVYRQAEESSIIDLAHHIRKGSLPVDFMEKKKDRSFIQAQSNQISSVIEQIVTFAKNKGYDSNNMQVLAPMYKGPAGINELNTMLQDLLNPPKPKRREVEHFDTIFRVGDKVIQLVNNTDEGIYNGDIGVIEAIFTEKETESKKVEILVCFDDKREFVYFKSDLDQLKLAYCTSIHKAQGSEYDLVILPLVDLYSRMLRKDLLYTAVTRAQSSLVMIGNPQSFYKAVSQNKISRKTHLKELIEATLVTKQENTKTLTDETQSIVEEKVTFELLMNNYLTIDPMIGMDGIYPEMFNA